MDIALPLAGIRVLDFSRLLPGPYAAMRLASLGADVLKIEQPGAGDPARGISAAMHRALDTCKRTLALDLKDPAGRAEALRLVDGADVLLETFRPGVMDRLGLGWAVLKARKPDLVMCAISGYGAAGSLADRAGHDINYVGWAGMLAANTDADGRPVLPNLQVGDLLGGAALAVQGILAALLAVRMGGPGRFVDVSMTHGVFAHNVMPLAALNDARSGGAPDRAALLTGGVPCYGVYRSRDGRWMAVGALELKFWEACCAVLGRPDLARRHWQLGQEPGSADALAVRAELEALFATRTQGEWTAAFAAADCCVSPVLTMAEALVHPLFAPSISDDGSGFVTARCPLRFVA
ncbi:crotonobetainyl-CoA:carnitine CoA-transferase CaiB-like acyl-CoA transferase [Pseudoduganella flava]|uniref:CoA transferase n=1 Tax=Pseudoduganella flava TaxID=871742 RepID=A0A562PES4_9BURK|nr:CaiB/BaiF CoA-transferase family protein [Pseudoduganella flava]QGZ38789.1 CoA transferase [Pseudoduganella flava]TWI42843.1 crotonobetainyl-CoA:carnitine CoA-transferase CaiB-like acyl-CoA transferase [Pseudoduganella flava]